MFHAVETHYNVVLTRYRIVFAIIVKVLIFVFGLVGLLLMILLVYLVKRYLQIVENDNPEIGESRKHQDLTQKSFIAEVKDQKLNSFLGMKWKL